MIKLTSVHATPYSVSATIKDHVLIESDLTDRDRLTKLEKAISLVNEATLLIADATYDTAVHKQAGRTILALSKINKVRYKSSSLYSIWNLIHDLGTPPDDVIDNPTNGIDD